MMKFQKWSIYVLVLFTLEILLTSAKSFSNDSTLSVLFAIDVIRHGDRTPAKDIPTMPFVWPDGIGNLTDIGKEQERELGKKVRSEYVTQFKILPSHYISNTLSVRSTDYPRTIMSAKAFLEGLYSIDEVALIPVQVVQKDQDFLVPSTFQYSLAKFEEFLDSQGDYARKFKVLLHSKLEFWRKATGMSLTSADDLIILGDHLFVRNIHHVPLPSNLEPSDIDTIQKLAELAITEKCNSGESFLRVGREFLQSIAPMIQDVNKKENRQKVQLYFAHDSTILAITSVLGVPQRTTPHYASRLNFLILNSPSGVRVQVSLNGTALHPPTCQTELCTFTEWNGLTHTLDSSNRAHQVHLMTGIFNRCSQIFSERLNS